MIEQFCAHTAHFGRKSSRVFNILPNFVIFCPVPSALITQLADRKQASAGVADAGMVDTVELLAWATGTIQDTDRHNLATQALAAAQVLQVRNNRQNTTD